jgi:hypothetical protein
MKAPPSATQWRVARSIEGRYLVSENKPLEIFLPRRSEYKIKKNERKK